MGNSHLEVKGIAGVQQLDGCRGLGLSDGMRRSLRGVYLCKLLAERPRRSGTGREELRPCMEEIAFTGARCIAPDQGNVIPDSILNLEMPRLLRANGAVQRWLRQKLASELTTQTDPVERLT